MKNPSVETWTYIDSFQSGLTKCTKCDGPLIKQITPAELTVYTREGTKFAQHFSKECSNHWCRSRFYHGYFVSSGEKIYEDLDFKSKCIVTSTETAFSLDFLYEQKLHMMHSNATFQGLSDTYNDFQNFKDSKLKRKDLNRKRLSDAFFLYGLLEYSYRAGFTPLFKTSKNWLDEALKEYGPKIKELFAKEWTGNHLCEVENCETVMISDGGMKIDRPVCAQKLSMLRKYSHSDKFVLTGCTASPSPDSPFCPDHRNSETPIILKENIREKNRKVLQNYRNKTKNTNLKIPEDNI